MARKIVVTSGKGGVGKTTLTLNLGNALCDLGGKVLLIDMDFGLNNLDVVMGVEDLVVYDIVDVINGVCRAKQALIQDRNEEKLYILPSVHHCHEINISYDDINKVISEIEYMFDYILLDCPAGIDEGFYRAVKVSDEAILVTTPHISALRDADKILSRLVCFDLYNISVVINRMRGDLVIEGDMLDEESIIQFLKVDLLGVVPEDDNISTSLLTGGVNKLSEAYVSAKMIGRILNGGDGMIYDCTKKYKGLLGGLRRMIRRKV